MWQEKVETIDERTGLPTCLYRVRTKVDKVEVVTKYHEIVKADEWDKENKPAFYVHRNDNVNIKVLISSLNLIKV